ncbi:hypothetical protein HC02_19670 [Vibrio parahaemolyticus]|nr:hypothetical protein HC02_19670 [Vibrio parahaemolyticus]
MLKTKRSLDESVALSQSAADDVRSAWGLFTDPFINLVSDIMSSSTGLTGVLSSGASMWANALNDSPLLTGALTVGGVYAGGKWTSSLSKGLISRAKTMALKYFTGGRSSVKPPAAEATIVDDAAKAAAEGADTLKNGAVADDAIKGASTAAKGAEEVATNSSILKKGAGAAGKVLKNAGKTGASLPKASLYWDKRLAVGCSYTMH